MLTTGQKLWYVPSGRRGNPSEVTVGKVGRKWAEIGFRLRINIETLEADGGQYSSPGRCWLTREAWEADMARHDAWCALREKMQRSWSPPNGVSIDDICRANALLGFVPLKD